MGKMLRIKAASSRLKNIDTYGINILLQGFMTDEQTICQKRQTKAVRIRHSDEASAVNETESKQDSPE